MSSFHQSVERILPYLCVLIYVLPVTTGTFIGGLWAAYGIGGAIVIYLGTWAAQGKRPEIDRAVMTFVALTLGTMALLNLRSYYPVESWHMLLKLTTILAPLALFFSPEVQRQFRHPCFFPLVALAACIGAAALGVEFLAGMPLSRVIWGDNAMITKYNRGISYLAVFAFPVMAYLWQSRPRITTATFILILLVPVALTDSRATKVALLIGLAATCAAAFAPVMVRRLLVGSLIILLAFPWCVIFVFLDHAPWIARLPASWQNRVEIWDYMSYRIFEHPFLGWGLGTSHLMPYLQPHGHLYRFVHDTNHPHNVLLQLWVNMGVPGVALGYMFAWITLAGAGRLPRPLNAFAMGAWTAALCISLVAYDFWSDSLFSLFAMTPLAFILLAQRQPET